MHAYITDCDTAVPALCDHDADADAEAAVEVLDDATARTLAGIFRALGDPTRIRLISLLAEREMCVRDLTAALAMGQPAVSHQLSDMRELGLVRCRKAGRHVYYRLDDEHVRGLYRLTLTHVRHSHADNDEASSWTS